MNLLTPVKASEEIKQDTIKFSNRKEREQAGIDLYLNLLNTKGKKNKQRQNCFTPQVTLTFINYLLN